MAFIISRTVAIPGPPGITGCAGVVSGVKSFGSRAGVAFWAPSFIFDAIVFGMTMYRSYITVKGNRSFGVLGVLRRDGSLYFACVFLTNIANFATLLGAPEDLTTINANLATALPVVITTRLILNLKSITHRRDTVNLASRDKVPLAFNNSVQLPIASEHTSTSWGLSTLIDVFGEQDTGLVHQPYPQSVTAASSYRMQTLA